MAEECASVRERDQPTSFSGVVRCAIRRAFAHRLEQFLRAKRLAQAVGRAELGCESQEIRRGALRVTEHEARHRDDRHMRVGLLERMDRFDPSMPGMKISQITTSNIVLDRADAARPLPASTTSWPSRQHRLIAPATAVRWPRDPRHRRSALVLPCLSESSSIMPKARRATTPMQHRTVAAPSRLSSCRQHCRQRRSDRHQAIQSRRVVDAASWSFR